MASLSSQANGTKIIQFKDTEGRRRTIRLGKCSKRDAERFKIRLEPLIFAKSQGHSPDEETARWLLKLDQQLLERLAAVDLIAPPSETLLIPFIETYIAKRVNELKTETIRGMRRALKFAKAVFGPDQSLRDFTAGDAKDFRLHLLDAGLAESSTRKNCAVMKQFFADAIGREIINRNPFVKVPTRIKAGKDKKEFVKRETIAKVIEACGDAEIRAIIALARFGGLRIASEINGLKWEHVLWGQNRILLPSPKTERFEGRDKRVFPLFPELRPHLDELWELAPQGAVYVCEIYRNRKRDISKAVEAAIQRSGVTRWPVLFHSLRATRQTELQEDFPAHVVCAWLGNTQQVARDNYLQVTDDHFARALDESAASRAARSAQSSRTHRPRIKRTRNSWRKIPAR